MTRGVLVFVVLACLAACGGGSENLLVGGATPKPTVTPSAATPTPGGCAPQGQGCDNITIFCCSPLTCVGGICE